MCPVGEQATVNIDGCMFTVPVKNTFIHYDFADKKPKPLRRSHSLPVMQFEFLARTRALVDASQLAEELLRSDQEPSNGSLLHDGRGSSRPCAWNWKPSGCSKGKSCEFCHTCDADQIKRKKKQRIAQLKAEKKRLTEQTLELQEGESDKWDKSDKSEKGSNDGRLTQDTSENSSEGSSSRRGKSTRSRKGGWKHLRFLKNQGNNLQ